MLHKRNLISIAVGAVFLLTASATTAFAADAAQGGGHQHQGGQAAGHDHGDTKSGNQHEHQGHKCEHKMSSVDANKDGKISKEEFMKHHEAMFDKKDTNKDGFLDDTERHRMKEHKHEHGEQQKGGAHAHGDAQKK